MIDLEKILVKIVLVLVTVLFIVLLFNSCKSHKQVVKTAIDSTATESVKVESHTTDNSTTQEDYTEITYVLDTTQSIVIAEGLGESVKVSQIKVKKSHMKRENDIDNKIHATKEKTAQIKEKTQTEEKVKPNTTKNLSLAFVWFVSLGLLFVAWWHFRH